MSVGSHWLTSFDPDDGEPCGAVCDCDIGADHFADGSLTDAEDEVFRLAASRPDVPALIAAELRAQAARLEAMIHPDSVLPEPHTLRMVVAQLYARADELDPPGGAR